MSKPTIVFDVDGVILNFCKPFAIWWNKRYMHERNHVCPENPSSWNMEYIDMYNPENSAKIINDAIFEFLQEKPMFPLMEENVASIIKNIGSRYRIHLVTAFPEKHALLREDNLNLFGIQYDDITYVETHKAATICKINPIAVVEDSPVHIKAITDCGYKVFVPIYWKYTHILYQNKIPNTYFYISWDDLRFKLRMYAPVPKKPIFKKEYLRI